MKIVSYIYLETYYYILSFKGLQTKITEPKKMSFKIGQTVKFGNLPTIGRVQMSNDLETFVIWNDGDKCAVATEFLKGVEA